MEKVDEDTTKSETNEPIDELIATKYACRMYNAKFPKKEDLVMCEITKIEEDGADVELIEYGRIKGYLLSSEMSRKRVKQAKQFVKVGKIEILRVARVDEKKCFTDLTKKAIFKNEEIKEFESFYHKSKTVHSIMQYFAHNIKADIEELYQNFGWVLYKKYEHAYDGLKKILTCPELLDQFEFKDNEKEILLKILNCRLAIQPVKIQADFKLTCSTYEGIDSIKNALIEARSISKELAYRYIGAPYYECVIEKTTNSEESLKAMQKSLKILEQAIKKLGGSFQIRNAPTIRGEHEKVEDVDEELARKDVEIDEDMEDHDEDIKEQQILIENDEVEVEENKPHKESL